MSSLTIYALRCSLVIRVCHVVILLYRRLTVLEEDVVGLHLLKLMSVVFMVLRLIKIFISLVMDMVRIDGWIIDRCIDQLICLKYTLIFYISQY